MLKIYFFVLQVIQVSSRIWMTQTNFDLILILNNWSQRLALLGSMVWCVQDVNDTPPEFKQRKYEGFMTPDLTRLRNDVQVGHFWHFCLILRDSYPVTAATVALGVHHWTVVSSIECESGCVSCWIRICLPIYNRINVIARVQWKQVMGL